MKHKLSIMLALLFTNSAFAYDLNEKLYFGVTMGSTTPFYKSAISDQFKQNGVSEKKFNINLGIVLGKSFGVWGIEGNAMILEAIKYSKQQAPGPGLLGILMGPSTTISLTQVDFLIGISAFYNFYNNQNWTCKASLGLSGIKSVEQYSKSSPYFRKQEKTVSYSMKLAPQVGLGAQYAFSDHLAATASINYLKPINHNYLANVIYANLGINIYV